MTVRIESKLYGEQTNSMNTNKYTFTVFINGQQLTSPPLSIKEITKLADDLQAASYGDHQAFLMAEMSAMSDEQFYDEYNYDNN